MNTVAFQNSLLTWFRASARPLPWRLFYRPYEVWISEIMLQQTQVVTALPYFERWMQKFPTVEALASAREEEVLKLWEGLGYYSRARNLLKAARQIVAEHHGVFPSDFASIRALPGIGDYTAGAISSIAFEADFPVVDGNVVRVLSRLDDFAEDVRTSKTYFWDRAQELLPRGQARDFNQGLMELGALICTPKKPACEVCPVRDFCLARARGTVLLRPVKSPAARSVKLRVVVAVLEHRGEFFVQQRAGTGLMAGLWEFPGGKVEDSESDIQALGRELREELGFEFSLHPQQFLMAIKHAYTKFLVDLQVYHAVLPAAAERPTFKLAAATQGRWAPLSELTELPFPAANKRILEKLSEI